MGRRAFSQITNNIKLEVPRVGAPSLSYCPLRILHSGARQWSWSLASHDISPHSNFFSLFFHFYLCIYIYNIPFNLVANLKRVGEHWLLYIIILYAFYASPAPRDPKPSRLPTFLHSIHAKNTKAFILYRYIFLLFSCLLCVCVCVWTRLIGALILI